jgi:type VI secretion system protein ImpC
MTRSSSLASVHIDVGEEPRELPRQEPDTPFRILVAGNFSGGASRIRKPILIDRDSFEEVLALIGPEIQIEFATAPIPIRFRELDDFHPDSLYERLPPFRALRNMRRQLEEGIVLSPQPETTNLSGADLLNSMLGEAPTAASLAPARSHWDAMLHELVAPYAEPKPDRRQPAMIAQTDKAITGEMRGVLHHKAFQDLEALWRGLFFLTRRLETSPDLKVYVWDMPQAELTTPEGLAALRRVAVEETVGTPGADPWSVIAGLYDFGNEHESALAQIAAIARTAGAPFLAGVARDVVGLTQVFQTLRRSADARWVGLAMPRFLLRLPYGERTDATERFQFEEMPEPPEHERYLWGNPAIVCAYLLGEAFSRSGWDMRPGEVNQIDGLPAHVYRKDGESELKPCAEVLLTEGSVEILLDLGMMPLISMKGTDRVRLGRFQSIAEPAAALSGRWG